MIATPISTINVGIDLQKRHVKIPNLINPHHSRHGGRDKAGFKGEEIGRKEDVAEFRVRSCL